MLDYVPVKLDCLTLMYCLLDNVGLSKLIYVFCIDD